MSAAPSRTLRLSLALTVALGLAACSSAASPSANGTPGPSTSPSSRAALLLRVSTEGGFINPASTLAALPTVTVYADGRIFMAGAPTGDNPSPLVYPVSVRSVGANGAAAIRAAIHAAGLDAASTGSPGVPDDSGVNVFEVVTEAGTVTSRFAGNGPGGGPGLPGSSGNPERAAALDLLGRLLDATDTWGAVSAPESVYQPLAYRVFVAPGVPAGEGSSTQPIAWPLATPLSEFGAPAVPDFGVTGLRSGIMHGTDVATAAPILRSATSSATFTSGGQNYTLFVRALLPDEVGA